MQNWSWNRPFKGLVTFFSEIGYPTLLAVLIFQLSLPYPLLAGDEKKPNSDENPISGQGPTPSDSNEPPAGDLGYGAVGFSDSQAARRSQVFPTQNDLESVSPSVREFAAQAERARTANAPFYLDNWKRNVGFILHHRYRKNASSEPIDISQLQLTVPSTAIQQGIPDYALGLAAEGSTLKLTLKGLEGIHEMDFKSLSGEQATIQDFDWDDEWVYVLLSNGELYAADVQALRFSMFRTWFPFYTLGNINKMAPGKAISKIRILQRRVDPADRTRAAQMARLDLNPSTAENIRNNATQDLVVRLKENLEMVRPFEVDADLARKLEKTEEGQVLIDAGNLGFFAQTSDGKETLVDVEPIEKVVAKVGLQEPFIEAMQHVADPDTKQSLRDLQGISEDALRELSAILADPVQLQEFEASGLREALSVVDKRTLTATREHTAALAKALLEAKKNGTMDALRDRFTPEQLRADFQYFESLVQEAEKVAAQPKSRLVKTMAALGRWSKKRWESFNPIRRMQAVATALKKPMIAAGTVAATALSADFLVNGDISWTIETLAGMWSLVNEEWVPAVTRMATDTMPVLNNPGYIKDMVLYSWPGRVGLFLTPVALAWLCSRWSQHSPTKLLVSKGIRWAFSWAMVPPVRAALSTPLLRRLEVLNAMKRGHLPVSLLRPFLTTSGLEQAREAATDRIRQKEQAVFVARAMALRVAADKRGMNPFDLLADIAQSPKSKATRKEIAKLTTALTGLVSNTEGDAGVLAIQSNSEDFVQALGEYSRVAESSPHTSVRPRPGALAQMRFSVMPQVIASAANFNEAVYEPVANPVPSEGAARYVVNSFLMDGAFSLGQTSFVGAWANPGMPDSLSHQPDGVLYTHTGVWIEENEQIALHLGLVAALVSATWSEEKRSVLRRYAPAATYDLNREVGSRGALRESGNMLKAFLDIRNNNWGEIFGLRSWKQCFTLFPGFFIIGMGVRMLEGLLNGHLSFVPGTSMHELATTLFGGDIQTFQQNLAGMLDPAAISAWGEAWQNALLKAVDGQLYFLFLAPFTYRYLWAIHQAVVNGMENEVAELGVKYQSLFTGFAQALSRRDLAQAEKSAVELIRLYQEEHRSIPDDIMLALERQDGEQTEAWLTRCLGAFQKYSAVPEQINPTVNRGVFLGFSFLTTLLAGFLMMGSLEGRSLLGDGTAPFGFDLAHWNLFAGSSKADGIHALIIKSLILINGIWLAGLGYKVAWDGGRLGLHKTRRFLFGNKDVSAELAAAEAEGVSGEAPAPAVAADPEGDKIRARLRASMLGVLGFFGYGKSKEALSRKNGEAAQSLVNKCNELLVDAAKR